MKSRTSYFNATLFTNLLKRFWPVFLAYFLVWAVALPVGLNSAMSWNTASDLNDPAINAANYVLSAGNYGGVFISALFAMIVAMAAFSYLYNSRSVSMICSLPIKREGVFASVFTAGLVGMLASNVLIFLITLGVEGIHGAIGVSYLLQWLAMVCLSNLFFYGFAALCASFTGHILVMPVVYIILNFTVFVVENIVSLIASYFVYGANTANIFTQGSLFNLTPILRLTTTNSLHTNGVNLPNGGFQPISFQYQDWDALIIYAIVGVLFALAAMLLIKHRRMETAGDVVAVKPLKPVFKYCLSAGCALVVGAILFSITIEGKGSVGNISSMLIMLAYMIIGAFIGYFAAEMLMQKTLRVFRGKSWIGFFATIAVISVIMFCAEYDVFGYEKRLPDINEVEGVNVYVRGETALFEQTDNIEATIALQDSIVKNKAANERLLLEQMQYVDLNSYNVVFTYTMKNGKMFQRCYNLYYEENGDIDRLNELMNVREAIINRKAISVDSSIENFSDAYIEYFDKNSMTHTTMQLSAEDAYELYSTCVVPDIDDETLGGIWLNSNSEDYLNTVYACRIIINFSQRVADGEYEYSYFETTATVNSQRTNQWLKEHGIELITQGERAKLSENIEPIDEGVVHAQMSGAITSGFVG